ncbi:MAG: uroporphyrinogen decarboxylase family protein [Armatimonadetes bacterium]|nr:uroporphyrinogen decarboxylase family protein [Armatimonadota bacterium]
MNSVERVFTTLEGKQADRVPLMELAVDPGIVKQILPEGDIFDLIEHLDLDVVPIGIMMDRRPVEWVDREQKIFRDKWGALQRLTTEVMPIPWHPARINDEADLDTYTPPDGNDEYFLEMTRKCVARFKDKRAICFVGEEVFAVQQYLRGGMESLMMDFATRPSLVKRLARIGVEYYIELYRRVIAEGVDIILLGDDYAWKMGPFMSPRHFEEYILPGFTQVVQEIRRAGAYCIKHTDGDIWKIMDMMAGAGLHAFGPLEPLPSMDLAAVKAHFGGKIAVVGNIDVDLLCRGTVDEVVAATKHLLNTASVGGGHIMSSGNSIISAVKPENYLAMVETTKRYGVYG